MDLFGKWKRGMCLASLIFISVGCGGGGGSSSPSGTVAPANSAPAAGFTVSAASGKTPLIVTFNASGSTDSDGTIASYTWSFGDGESGSGVSATHTYDTVGTYTAQLTVTDNGGLSAGATRQITVTGYTLSGTVTSAAHNVTDGDVNDSKATIASNNSFDTAQAITAPVTVSGYVNVPGAGAAGASHDKGDTDDYFQVTLSKGMVINLYMAEDPAYAELNLYLYDSGRVPKNFTFTGSNGTASLEVPADGTYYVRVEAVADATVQSASGYALTLGLSSTAADDSSPHVSDEFVPGDVLVRFKEDSGGAGVSLAAGAKAAAMGFSTRAGGSGRDRLLRRSATMERKTLFKNLGIQSAVEKSLSIGNMDARTREKMETLWMIRGLRKQPGLVYADPNYIRKPLATTPNDPYYALQWHYPLIHLPDAWTVTTGSSSVVVAVVDTGVLLKHPDFVNTDLSSQLVDGYDFISSTSISRDGNGVDSNPDDPGDESGGGSSFHGTHVAGTIAAASNNKTGVAGIAWKTKIMPLRVLGAGGGTSYDIMQAVKYAAGLKTDYAGIQLAQPVDVINLSLGGYASSTAEQAVYREARAQGVIIVAAAGNSGSSRKMYPAAYDGVVSVSAVTIGATLASYSNYGNTIDVAAPGGSSTDSNGDGNKDGVFSTVGYDSSGTVEMGYAWYMGTSMATPHVTGVVALMKALYPGLTPDKFDTLLRGGYLTQDLGASGRDDKFGYGLIDAYKAVLVAQKEGIGEIQAILSASPGNISLGSELATAVITLANGGNAAEALKATGFSIDAAWLTVQATAVDASGLGTYTVTVNRTGLSEGTYSGTVTFTSDKNSASVAVVMQVGAGSATLDGGYHYIFLMDPDTLETVAQTSGAGKNGVYEYSIPGLSYGNTYLVYAGTDPDNDGYICGSGEACGAYLSIDQPEAVTITGDTTGIDFTTDINISLPAAASSRFAETELPLQRQAPKEVMP